MVLGSAAEEIEIKQDMTPMIDVVFQLLIFFMCTIKFKTLEGKVSAYLPKYVGVSAPEAKLKLDRVEIRIRVLDEGTKLHPTSDAPWRTGPFRYGPDRKLEFQVGSVAAASFEELSARLAELHRAQPDRGATIDPCATPLPAVYADLVGVLNSAVRAGFTSITFKGAK